MSPSGVDQVTTPLTSLPSQDLALAVPPTSGITAEADSIVFGSQVSIAGLSGRAGVFFGLTSGASLNISFITAQTTQVFGKQVGANAGTSSVGFGQAFQIANSNKVTYGIDSNNYVTLAFAGGGSLSIQGLSSAEAKAITNTFGLAKGGGNPAGTTGTFGTAGTFQRSADIDSISEPSKYKAPSGGLFYSLLLVRHVLTPRFFCSYVFMAERFLRRQTTSV